MRWLKDFKSLLENNPDVTDAELFRAFPELRFDQQRLNGALLYWRYGIVAEYFKKITLWDRIKKTFLNGIRSICFRGA